MPFTFSVALTTSDALGYKYLSVVTNSIIIKDCPSLRVENASWKKSFNIVILLLLYFQF
jgi:hypothetical protein